MIENLTKENFWNEMQEKYPKAMKKFCDWIDKYKSKHGWGRLFNAGYDSGYTLDRDSKMTTTQAPKYHELPIAFQYGMFIEFIGELYHSQGIVGDVRKDLISVISNTLDIEEKGLDE